jgi:hypothetical protein
MMPKIEEFKKKFDSIVEEYKSWVSDLEDINTKINEELVKEVKKAIKDEKFVLKISPDDGGKFILYGSDRVVLKLHNLRQYGMSVYLNDEKTAIILIESGTLVMSKDFDPKMLAELNIDIDTKDLDLAIIELQKINRLLKNPSGEIYDVPDSGSIISDNSI